MPEARRCLGKSSAGGGDSQCEAQRCVWPGVFKKWPSDWGKGGVRAGRAGPCGLPPLVTKE